MTDLLNDPPGKEELERQLRDVEAAFRDFAGVELEKMPEANETSAK